MEAEIMIKCIREMVKQFNKIKDEDEFREKSINLIHDTLLIEDIPTIELLLDLSLCGDGIYVAKNGTEFYIKIEGEDLVAKDNKKQCVVEIEYKTKINSMCDLLDILDKYDFIL